ncbi:hypothetical protein HDU97_003398 [Phlyctochytrium planicorne]|nr:hypothetical protein HDU97_003398 [Phlyctochytrium planicorne]
MLLESTSDNIARERKAPSKPTDPSLPYYLSPSFIPEKATVNQLKSILAECNVDMNFNSRPLKDDYVQLFRRSVANNAHLILTRLASVKPSGEGITSVDSSPIKDKMVVSKDKENMPQASPMTPTESKAAIERASAVSSNPTADAFGFVKERATMLRQQVNSNVAAKDMTPSIAALKRRGVTEDSHVDSLVKQYNLPESSIPKPPFATASLEHIKKGTILKRSRALQEDLESFAQRDVPAGLPSGLQKPSKLYRPMALRNDDSPPSSRPDFVVPRTSPPLVTSTGLMMPISFVDKADKKKTPSPQAKNLKVAANAGLKSGPRRIRLKGTESSPQKDELLKDQAPPSSFALTKEDFVNHDDIAEKIFGAPIVPDETNDIFTFLPTKTSADFSFTVPDAEQNEMDFLSHVPEAADKESFESMNPSRRLSIVPPSPFAETLSGSSFDGTPPLEVPRSVLSARVPEEISESSPESSQDSPLKSYSTKSPRTIESPRPMGSPLLTKTLRQRLELNLMKELDETLKPGRSLASSRVSTPQKIKDLLRKKGSVKASPTKGKLLRESLEVEAEKLSALLTEKKDAAPAVSEKTSGQLMFSVMICTALFVILSLGLSVSYYYFKEGHSLQYCDTAAGGASLDGSAFCVPCPSHFNCVGGHIASCLKEGEVIASLPLFGPLGVSGGLTGACALPQELENDELYIFMKNIQKQSLAVYDATADMLFEAFNPTIAFLDSIGVDPNVVLTMTMFLGATAFLMYTLSHLLKSDKCPEESSLNEQALAEEILDKIRVLSKSARMMRVDQLRDSYLPLHNLPSSSITIVDVVRSLISGKGASEVSRDRVWSNVCMYVRSSPSLVESMEESCPMWSWEDKSRVGLDGMEEADL